MAASLVLASLSALALSAREPEPLAEFCPLYNVFFAEGSARLSGEAKAVIDNWAQFARLLEMPRNLYLIEAVAMDRSRSAGVGLDLSFRRGRAIVRYLSARGFDPARFRVRALGRSGEPWHSSDSSAELNRARNRRATLILETTGSNWRRVMGDRIC